MQNQLNLGYYKPFSYPFVKAYITTMRPYLMFVSGVTGIAGISFGFPAGDVQLVLIFLASFLSYGFGQALTDCFQTDTDSISSPYRPLTQNLVSKKAFLITSAAGLSFCVGIFAVYNNINIFPGVLAGAGLATYTYFKRRWWGGPFYNAWIVMVLFFMALLASAGNPFSDAVIPSAIAVLFGYANFVLSGYFKDIEADRVTGYNTLPVVYGRNISSIVSDIFALVTLTAALSVLLISNSISRGNLPALIFFAGGTVYSVYAQIKLHAVRTDDEAFKAISPVVHAYILLLSSIALSLRPEWLVPLVVFYLFYLLVLEIRPSKEQI
jgi:4-hydroxybenzoate polyprenyltransferase